MTIRLLFLSIGTIFSLNAFAEGGVCGGQPAPSAAADLATQIDDGLPPQSPPVGVVSESVGAVFTLDQDGNRVPLKVGDPIESDTQVQTDEGTVKIRAKDSELDLGPKSKLEIKDTPIDQESRSTRARLVRGTSKTEPSQDVLRMFDDREAQIREDENAARRRRGLAPLPDYVPKAAQPYGPPAPDNTIGNVTFVDGKSNPPQPSGSSMRARLIRGSVRATSGDISVLPDGTLSPEAQQVETPTAIIGSKAENEYFKPRQDLFATPEGFNIRRDSFASNVDFSVRPFLAENSSLIFPSKQRTFFPLSSQWLSFAQQFGLGVDYAFASQSPPNKLNYLVRYNPHTMVTQIDVKTGVIYMFDRSSKKVVAKIGPGQSASQDRNSKVTWLRK